MRKELRKYLLSNIDGLEGIYEPTVPDESTPKPYLVIEQLADTENTESATINHRNINIWIYCDRTSFGEVDDLQDKIIEALNFSPIEFETDTSKFTCIYGGVSKSDIVDVNMDLICRPLQFKVIALNNTDNSSSDVHTEAFSSYLSNILKTKNDISIEVYRDRFKSDFKAPCILCRKIKSEKVLLNKNLIQIDKVYKVHVVDKKSSNITTILERIENKLMSDQKIYYDIENKTFKLVVSKIIEDREADMFINGQIQVSLRLYAKPYKEITTVNTVYDNHGMIFKGEE